MQQSPALTRTAASLVTFKRADFEFVRSERDIPHLPQKNPSHLPPNRPSDQLSWRTPRPILSMNPVAKATKRFVYRFAQLRRPRRKARKNLPPTANPAPTTMHSPTLANDFPSRSTRAFSLSQPLLSHCAPCLPNKPRVLIPLRTLFLSLRSFRRSPRLFSIACGLFLQNTGGWGCSHLAVQESPVTNHKSRQPLALCFPGLMHGFSRNPFLKMICVAGGCGVSDLLPLSAIPVPVDGPAA